MEASFFSKPLQTTQPIRMQKVLPPAEEEGIHPMRMHVSKHNNTTSNASNENVELKSYHNCSMNQNAGM